LHSQDGSDLVADRLQQFEVESLGVGAQGQIKDKKTGRCLQTKGCGKPQ